jgi:hypothetical protein
MKQPWLLHYKLELARKRKKENRGYNLCLVTLTIVFSGLLKYGFQPMLMTILKTPIVDTRAQPKYTPEGCSERTVE